MGINNLIIGVINSIGIYILVLISVAYLTLAERKVLGYTQSRKGPNVVGLYGLLQPLADGVKLFSKEIIIPSHINVYLFLLSPIIALIFSLFAFYLLPNLSSQIGWYNEYGLILILVIGSLGIYAVLIGGWSSHCKYALLGALRAAAQMISYEIALSLVFLIYMIIISSFSSIWLLKSQIFMGSFFYTLWPLMVIFMISCLVETSRAPFDLAEGESELVSGFNVEYSGMAFALFFLAEYGHIILTSFLFTCFFFGGKSILIKMIVSVLMVYFFIWVRTSYPRLRYDHLMNLLWTIFFPILLLYFVIVYFILI